MTISIIIPTKNRALLLDQCLNCLVNQLEKNDEVIIVDDGKDEATGNIVKKYSIKSNLHYLTADTNGPSNARNMGFSLTRGEGIAFLDDDCTVGNGWLSSIKKTLTDDKHRGKYYVHQGKITHSFKSVNFLEKIFLCRYYNDWQKIRQDNQFRKYRYLNFINAGNFFLLKSVAQKLPVLFDAGLFPFIGEERDLAVRFQLAGYPIRFESNVAVVHHKKNIRLFRSLIVSFRYGRAYGILENKYRAKRKTTEVFKNKLQTHVKNEVRYDYSVGTLAYIILINLFFYLGKTATKIIYRF